MLKIAGSTDKVSCGILSRASGGRAALPHYLAYLVTQLRTLMAKSIISVVAGYATWTVVFLGGSEGIRAAFSSAHMEDGSVTDLVTLLVYLAVSILASGLAGYVGAPL